MEAFHQDLRYALVLLRRNPGFATVAILALALGIGANTTMFSVVHGVVLAPLPYPEPDRLVKVQEIAPGGNRWEASYPGYLDWERRSRSFEHLTALQTFNLTLTGGLQTMEVRSAFVTPNMFDLLQVVPSLGRSFAAEENRPGNAFTVLISDGLWRREFGASSDVQGRAITVDGSPATIIGVMPRGFEFPDPDVQIWGALGSLADLAFMKNRAVHVLSVVGRLAEGVSEEQATAEMSAIAAQLEMEFPGEDPRHGAAVASLHEILVGDVKPALVMLLAAVAFVLLIACANVANLLVARAAARDREMAVRSVLGASRWRTLRQMLTESAVLGLLSGAVSLLLATWSVDLLAARLASVLPRAANIRLDATVLVFTLGVSLATGLLFGLLPTLGSRLAPLEALQNRASGSPSRRRLRSALIVAEVALSVVLLVGAFLMLQSFWRVAGQEPGFRPERLLVASVLLPEVDYPDLEAAKAWFARIPRELETLPGVEAASAVNSAPISGGDSNGMLTIDGRPFAEGEAPGASYRRILPDYFRVLGVPLLRGREFDVRDDGSNAVVIINEAMARQYFAHVDPIGQRIKVGPPENEPWLTIVGVVGDVRNAGLEAGPRLATYEPHSQRGWRSMELLVRTRGEAHGEAESVRRTLLASAPGILIREMRTMDERIHASLAPRRLNAWLLGTFAGLALGLACIGLYGVMSYLVTRRTHEIGVRVALGAVRSDVLRLVVGQGMRLVVAGVLLGTLGGLAVTRVLSSLLFEVSPTDPRTFAAAAAALTIVALSACLLPAYRATRVSPVEALRCE
ncbi:MAG TPA: ABC transporter permease [Vicinamibacterales bacterium]|nr:ABC transporter permease [Vicinamibacterales bacterium]